MKMRNTILALLALTALFAMNSAFASGDLANDPICIDLAGNVAKKLVDFAVEPGQPLNAPKVVLKERTSETATYEVTVVTKAYAPETVIYDVTLTVDSNSCVLDSVKFVSVK
jgi:hypothetical protein